MLSWIRFDAGHQLSLFKPDSIIKKIQEFCRIRSLKSGCGPLGRLIKTKQQSCRNLLKCLNLTRFLLPTSHTVSLAPKGKKKNTGFVRNTHSSCLVMHNKFTSAEIKRNAIFMLNDFKLIYRRPDNRVVSYCNAGFLLPKGQTINYTKISPAVFHYLSRHETFLPWITQGDLTTWLFICAAFF